MWPERQAGSGATEREGTPGSLVGGCPQASVAETRVADPVLALLRAVPTAGVLPAPEEVRGLAVGAGTQHRSPCSYGTTFRNTVPIGHAQITSHAPCRGLCRAMKRAMGCNQGTGPSARRARARGAQRAVARACRFPGNCGATHVQPWPPEGSARLVCVAAGVAGAGRRYRLRRRRSAPRRASARGWARPRRFGYGRRTRNPDRWPYRSSHTTHATRRPASYPSSRSPSGSTW